MPNYQNAVIYTITSGDHLYVGSTCNFASRKYAHSSCVNSHRPPFRRLSNQHLYFQIAHNNFEWEMKPYKTFPCNSKMELMCEEQRIIHELNPNMNERRANKRPKNVEERNRGGRDISCEHRKYAL